MKYRTWAKINLDAIKSNVAVINSRLGAKTRLMAIVKADAYGHGSPQIARELADCGVGFFGVSSVDEAVQLRREGISGKILVLGFTLPEDMGKLYEYRLTQTVFSPDCVKRLEKYAPAGGKIDVHIKIDTGMNRLGFKFTEKNRAADSVDWILRAAKQKSVNLEGIYTHFAAADDVKSRYTASQLASFLEFREKLKRAGLEFEISHAANSAATLNFPEAHLDYVRCGLILYGLYPSKNHVDIGLSPAMELKTTVSQVASVAAGETVSYSRTYQAGGKILAATLPIGYADGFSRLFSNSASVIINGKKAPVIGRVCMDQCVVDVTACGAVAPGDTATIFGADGAELIPVDQLAEMAETINYEVVCLIGKRVPRVFYRNGEEVGRLNYIINN